MIEIIIKPCETNWWSSLLYIQTYGFPLCISPTWYLSIEFQYFIFLSPVLLLTLKRWPKQVLWITGFLVLVSIVTSFVTGWMFNFYAVEPRNTRNPYYNEYFYQFLPTRASSWLIGFIFGYFMFYIKREEEKLKMNEVALKLCLIIAIIMLVIITLITYHLSMADYNKLEQSIFLALLHPVFIISVAVVTFACHAGCGGMVNTFLSNSVFQVLAKLSYNMYLIHFIVIAAAILSERVAPYVTNVHILMYDVPGHLFLSFLLSVVLSLSFELPIQYFVTFLISSFTRKIDKPK